MGATAAAAAELALAPSATSAARSATLLVRALRLPLEVETIARSVVDPKRLGRFFLWFMVGLGSD